MAQRNTTVNHFEPYARGVQHFVKYFLGGPDKPQDFPPPPDKQEKDSQYWVERRTQFIMKQLSILRDSLRDKSVAEQDYFVSRAESEIRKKIQPPPFTPAPKKGDLRGSRPISLQIKSAVERELAAAGISRMTFDWTARPMDTSSWNTAVVEVMARKSVEWLSLSMKLSDQDAGQAQAIIQRWLQGKCREIQKHGNVDVNTYQAQKKVKLNKAQYTRWRKKVSSLVGNCSENSTVINTCYMSPSTRSARTGARWRPNFSPTIINLLLCLQTKILIPKLKMATSRMIGLLECPRCGGPTRCQLCCTAWTRW